MAARAGAEAPAPLIIDATRLVELDRGASRVATIIIQNGKVSWIGEPSEAQTPAGSVRIDGRGTWVVPGLIELHSHYTDEPSLRRALALGVTTAHTIASPDHPPDLLQRSNDAFVPTPRLQLTTALFGEFPEHVQPGRYRIRNPRNAREARRDVAELRLEGASAVKIWQDDGLLWFGEQTTFPPMPEGVFREIVEAAHEQRMRVYPHVWRKRYAEVAVESGVDALIHPVADGLLEDRHFEMMRKRGIPWTTTLAVVLAYGEPGEYARRILSDPILRAALTPDELARFEADAEATTFRFHELMPELAAERSKYRRVIAKNTLRAKELGVPIALGSDEIVGIGTHIEMELLREMGLSPLEVLRAATRGSAIALGLEDIVGVLEPGMAADLLVLRSDPRADVKNLRDIEWVVKGGVQAYRCGRPIFRAVPRKGVHSEAETGRVGANRHSAARRTRTAKQVVVMTGRYLLALICAVALAGRAQGEGSEAGARRMHLHTIPAAWSSESKTVVAEPTLQEIVVSHQRSFFPSSEGPFPTVIAAPGCSGVSLNGPATDEGRPGDEADRLFRRHYPRMAERLRTAGFGVVLVDYLTAENVANTCSGEISHERVGEYVAAALDLARTLPRVDASRLYVIGWSHGGAGVIAWLQTLEMQTSRQVAGAVAVYPGCGSRDIWVSDVPVMVVLGEADDITPPERCDRILARLPESARVEVRRYANARHGFDFTEGPEILPIGGGMTVGRNAAAGEEAWAEILAFLGRN
jgi:imidazolonepropionase-like amidohydrolase/dienelactone hydrolase